MTRPTADLLRRGEAWGLTRIWLGAGPRPPGGLAEHTVWLEGTDPARSARARGTWCSSTTCCGS